MVDLRIDRCSAKAARYAVEHWHYSQRWPFGKAWCRGVWEDGEFVGAVVFGRGSSARMTEFWGLKQTECVELVRVAFREHVTPISQVVAVCLRQLKEANPGLRLVVSFADPAQAHHGGIYQAGNWIYAGRSKSGGEYVINGRQVHMRVVGFTWGTTSLEWIRENVDANAYAVQPPDKYRYAMPLDKAMRRQVEKRRQPAPEPLTERAVPVVSTRAN